MKNIIATLICITTIVSCQQKRNESQRIAINEDQSKLEESINRGKIVYNDMCINCHLANGKGVPKVFPPLADSDYLRENQIKSIKAIKNGLSGKITVNGITYNSTMTSLGLTNKEVADVFNYINNSWNNANNNFMTPEKVSEL